MLSLPVLLYTQISIHAPRTGSDPQGRRPRWSAHHISIHAPRTGSDSAHFPSRWGLFRFQSTLPARGATWKPLPIGARLRYFNPRSPHGERHDFRHSPERAEAISIHAPRTGSDRTLRNLVNIVNSFQSTLPARGATRYHFFRRLSNVISIHAPRTGSDL